MDGNKWLSRTALEKLPAVQSFAEKLEAGAPMDALWESAGRRPDETAQGELELLLLIDAFVRPPGLPKICIAVDE